MALQVEWDQIKAESNLEKHGISFEEAATVLGDPLSITIPDPDHSEHEERFLLLGESEFHKYLIVSLVEHGDRIRLISARLMTPRERSNYENARL